MHDRPSTAGLLAAAIAATMTVAYLVLAVGEGDNDGLVVASFAVIMGLGAVAAFAGALAPGPARRALLGTAALMLFPVGVLGLFSIGLPLLVAAILAAAGAAAARST